MAKCASLQWQPIVVFGDRKSLVPLNFVHTVNGVQFLQLRPTAPYLTQLLGVNKKHTAAVSLSGSPQLAELRRLRNDAVQGREQPAAELFPAGADAPPKKRAKRQAQRPAEEGLHALQLCFAGHDVEVLSAGRNRQSDVCVRLEPSALAAVLNQLQQDVATCSESAARSYKKSGKYAGRGKRSDRPGDAAPAAGAEDAEKEEGAD